YAVKRSTLSRKILARWVNVYQEAYSKMMEEIVPVYIANDGMLYTEESDEIYYLMPWIQTRDPERKQTIEQTYRAMGRFHYTTKRPVSLKVEEVRSEFQSYKPFIKQHHAKLTRYVEAL